MFVARLAEMLLMLLLPSSSATLPMNLDWVDVDEWFDQYAGEYSLSFDIPLEYDDLADEASSSDVWGRMYRFNQEDAEPVDLALYGNSEGAGLVQISQTLGLEEWVAVGGALTQLYGHGWVIPSSDYTAGVAREWAWFETDDLSVLFYGDSVDEGYTWDTSIFYAHPERSFDVERAFSDFLGKYLAEQAWIRG